MGEDGGFRLEKIMEFNWATENKYDILNSS